MSSSVFFPGGPQIEIIVNPFLPPRMIVAMQSNLTDEEKRNIGRAREEARAAGNDEAAIAMAGWEVLIKTGKVATLHCGKGAAADIAGRFSPSGTMRPSVPSHQETTHMFMHEDPPADDPKPDDAPPKDDKKPADE